MTPLYVLALMAQLPVRPPVERLAPLASAIATAAESEAEAAELVAVSWAETGLGRSGVPFGATCHRGPDRSLEAYAATALRVLRLARRDCGPALAARHSRYVTGRCAVTPEGLRRAALVRRLRRAR